MIFPRDKMIKVLSIIDINKHIHFHGKLHYYIKETNEHIYIL